MKLTLVSIVYQGITYSTFVECQYVHGKAVVPTGVLSNLLREAGGYYHDGATVTVG